jgi:LL-diaminopimelate aminotransferase
MKKLKTNIDSGTPSFIQDGAIAALGDEEHVSYMRNLYRSKRDVLLGALSDAGLTVEMPEATFYVWQRVPDGYDSVEFAKKLLADDLALVVTPGAWITDTAHDGTNPGDQYVRFALVPRLEQVEEAASRIRKHLKL